MKKPWLTKEQRQQLYPDWNEFIREMFLTNKQRYIVARVWEITDERWVNPHYDESAEDPNSWNDWRQGNTTKDYDKFIDFVLEILEFLLTNRQSYMQHCMCGKAPVNPLRNQKMCCDDCRHPTRLSLAGVDRKVWQTMTIANAPEFVAKRVVRALYDWFFESNSAQAVKFFSMVSKKAAETRDQALHGKPPE